MKKMLSTLLGSLITAAITVASLPIGNAVVNAAEDKNTPDYVITGTSNEEAPYIVGKLNDDTLEPLEAGDFIYPGVFEVNILAEGSAVNKIIIAYPGSEDFAAAKDDSGARWELNHIAKIDKIILNPGTGALTVELLPAYNIKVGAYGDVEVAVAATEDKDYFVPVEMADLSKSDDAPWYESDDSDQKNVYFTGDAVLKIGSGKDNKLMNININGKDAEIKDRFGNNFYAMSDFCDEAGYLEVLVDVMPMKLFNIRWHQCDAVVPEDKDFDENEGIKHGWAYIVGIYEVSEDGEEFIDVSDDFDFMEDGGVDENGFGDIFVPAGYVIEFEFIPEHGYQLTKVLANDFEQEPGEEVNHYFFTMPDSNVHFVAEFTETKDIVNTEDSKTVIGGSLELSADEILGSAKLIIVDKDKFEGKLDTDTYESVATMSIDLYNVFNKANTDGETWDIQITDLEEEALVTIKLTEPLDLADGEVIYIAHDHNGKTEYIPVEYNKSTLELTFKVSGFSDFAIVIKKADPQTTTPTTTTAPSSVVATGEGYSVTYTIGALMIAAAACVVLTTVRVKKNKEEM